MIQGVVSVLVTNLVKLPLGFCMPANFRSNFHSELPLDIDIVTNFRSNFYLNVKLPLEIDKLPKLPLGFVLFGAVDCAF